MCLRLRYGLRSGGRCIRGQRANCFFVSAGGRCCHVGGLCRPEEMPRSLHTLGFGIYVALRWLLADPFPTPPPARTPFLHQLATPILSMLDGSPNAWLGSMMQAFNMGDIDAFNKLCAENQEVRETALLLCCVYSILIARVAAVVLRSR